MTAHAPKGLAGGWLYHYTLRAGLDGILRDRVIQARSMPLYRTMMATDTPTISPPLVWLTINPVIEGTVAVTLLQARTPLPWNLFRLVLPRDYTDLSLPEWCDQAGSPIELWEMVVRTANMAGSSYTTWRVVPHDIPLAAVSRIEVLSGVTEGGLTTWIELETEQ